MIVAVVLAALGGMAIAQDKYSVQVPDGLAFSDFRGYEDWQVVSVAMVDPTGPAMSSESGAVLNVIVANPAMIDAYRNGVPGNGRKFPDGSKIAKMQWIPKKSAEAPFSVNVPEILRNVGVMEKDSNKFRDSGGWGYANFNYDAAMNMFTPDGRGSSCGYGCHTVVEKRDYIFHSYQAR
jgi:hypothetical protein